jgi:hypothetical protein
MKGGAMAKRNKGNEENEEMKMKCYQENNGERKKMVVSMAKISIKIEMKSNGEMAKEIM